MKINKESIKDCIKYSRFYHDNDFTAIKQAYNDMFTDYVNGGYPVLFELDGYVLCAKCAKREYIYNRKNFREDMSTDIYYEGATLACDKCHAEIESAYGNPDNPSHDDDL